MAKKKNNNLWYILGGVVVIILIIWIIATNINNNRIVCNTPYIKVGQSCCLDENYNGVCDNDEIEEIEMWKFSSFEVGGGVQEDFLQCVAGGGSIFNFDSLSSSSAEDITFGDSKYDIYDPDNYRIYANDYYETAVLVAYTHCDNEYAGNFRETHEGVSCEVEEYYDNVFNEVNTVKFQYRGVLDDDMYGFFWQLHYEVDVKPSEAKYIITCKGDTSENEFKKTFRFHIEYVDELGIIVC